MLPALWLSYERPSSSAHFLYPRGNNYTDSTGFWVPSPFGRGTYDLITSCLATLFLCAWTAVHLNVAPSPSGFRPTFSRLQWMLIAVFVPETVLFLSWHQFTAAKNLKEKINRLGKKSNTSGESENWSHCICERANFAAGALANYTPRNLSTRTSSSSNSTATHEPIGVELEDVAQRRKEFVPWTMKEAFYATCGGFAVDTSSFWHTPYMTLTPLGVLRLAQEGRMPRISRAAIEDKSKADIVTKILVMLQAGWFVAQCIARGIQGLPLTLLEIHTLTHIGCALAMYVVWFSKPYNVMYPSVIEDETTISLAALFALNTQSFSAQWTCCRKGSVDVRAVRNANPARENSPKVFEHLKASHQAIAYLRKRGSHFSWRTSPSGEVSLGQDYLVPYRSNYHIEGNVVNESIRGSKDEKSMLRNIVLLLIISAAYGGAHLSAWTAHFPTVLEMWLWRASAFSLIVTPLTCFLMPYSHKLRAVDWADPESAHLRKKWKKRDRIRACLVAEASCCIMLFIMLLLTPFPFARIYLLAESFGSLRDVPRGTFETVRWLNIVPHIG